MIIILHKNFEKRYAKLPKKVCERFKERRTMFTQDRFDPILENHALSGDWLGCRSINITGDYRTIFEEDGDIVTFVAIGTHSELYE